MTSLPSVVVDERCGCAWRRRWEAWMVVGVVVMDVEGPEVVEEEAVDVRERRRLVLAVLVCGGGRGDGAIAVHVHRRGSGEPAGGEEARTGDVRRNG